MRDIPVGNGSLLVNFDDKYQIRDVYFPHVGQENHSEGFPFRFGVWVDGEFSWVFEDGWIRSLKYLPETLVTDVTLTNDALGIRIECNDTVAGDENIYLRRLRVTNLKGMPRHVRVFLHHDFRIYENKIGDTAFFDPDTHALIHYKKHRYFLINTDPSFDAFATGRKAFRNSEGTWRDAEDGDLAGGPITEGSVDSTIGVHFELSAGGSYEFYYWIAAAASHGAVDELNAHVHSRSPAKYFRETENHWHAWVNKNSVPDGLPPEIIEFYKRSLLILKTQIDHGGAIIAANDSDVSERATDNYSYQWMRDGSFVANALDVAGYPEISRNYFHFCAKVMHEKGYFLQKYNPDGTLGSSWHPRWDNYRKLEMVPIQEDETALVLWALWKNFEKYHDIELIRELYHKLVVSCADFMLAFRDSTTKLPLPSWNLWEDRCGVHTFTCATVVAGLRAAANMARLFADDEKAAVYEKAADEIVAAMAEHLYSPTLGRFIRSLQSNGDDSLTPDPTVDASLFGIFYFDCFDVNDAMVAGTMKAIDETLRNKTEFGGIARFENDGYMRVSDDVTGNSWFICTLWMADYHIAKAATVDEMAPALDILKWTAERALPSGVLAEQVNPLTGEELSVSPLTWSHSTFVATLQSYLKKLSELEAAPVIE